MSNAEKLAKYAEKNPVMIYGDYRDELPDDIIEAILEGNQDKAYELMSDCEFNMMTYEQWSPEQEALKEACNELDIEFDSLSDDEIEAFSSSVVWDYSDFWNSCFNNSRANIAVTILNDNGETIEGPHWENGEEENKDISDFLMEHFGDNGEKSELTYAGEVLKIGGSYDLKTLLEKGLPDFIEISPNDSDNLLFHGSWNGSGNLGSFIPTKTRRFKCSMRYDDKHKYGIDAVYGFTRKYWDHDLNFIWNEKGI